MNNVCVDDFGNVKEFTIDTYDTPESVGNHFSTGDCLEESFFLAKPLVQAPHILGTGSHTHVSANRTTVSSYLQIVPHLFTLSEEEIAGLDVMIREYREMNIIIDEGLLLQHVYVLASGTVEVMNSKKGLKRALGHRRIGSIIAPNIFGIDDVILGSPSEFTYHASSKCTLLLIPKEQFIQLFSQSPIFASSVSSRILKTLPAFTLFHDFCRSLFGLSSSIFDRNWVYEDEGFSLSLPVLVSLYMRSGTVFHKLVNDIEIDGEALRYCVRRLPSNITKTYVLILTTSLCAHIFHEFSVDVAEVHKVTNSNIMTVDTGKRHRCAWTFGGGGQTLVMMRDNFTDSIDLVSNLCMLTVEAKKIRTRLKKLVAPSAINILRKGLSQQSAGLDISSTLKQLPFSVTEIEALKNAWGKDLLSALYNIVFHREGYVIHVDPPITRRFVQGSYANWSLTIMLHIKAALGLPTNSDIPEDIVIDILFSPNRILKNLFCSMDPELKSLVMREADNHKSTTPTSQEQGTSAAIGGLWKNPEDRFFYVLTSLLEQNKTVCEAYRVLLESSGFTLLKDAYGSALIVDLIDVSCINMVYMDTALRSCAEAAKKKSIELKRHFIINVDKTFGAQIEIILRHLLLTFGNRVRSVNLMSKAAGMKGNRGDVVLPSRLLFSKRAFGEDSLDEIRLCNQNSFTLQDIQPFLGESSSATIRGGTCITFPGFILQNEPVLSFYRTVHGVTALEMQSSYVARQLEEYHRCGILSKTVTSRYLFYTDEMPLGNENGTELKSQKREIISTIYASERSILCRILSSS